MANRARTTRSKASRCEMPSAQVSNTKVPYKTTSTGTAATLLRVAMPFVMGAVLAQNTADGQLTVVPDRTVIPAVLLTTIDTKNAKPDKRIELETTADVRAPSGKIVIPRGAKVSGRVTEAVPWFKDKPESKVSIVVESAKWKDGSAALHAFIAGDLNILSASEITSTDMESTASAEPAPPARPAGGSVTGSPVGNDENDMVRPRQGTPERVPPGSGLARDRSLKLQIAASKKIVTEVVSQAHNVRMEQGSTFVVRQLSQ
jgi:hypothetical protein